VQFWVLGFELLVDVTLSDECKVLNSTSLTLDPTP
jgi:hypothetical protein